MEELYNKIDLHIHTPASNKCYLGPKSDEEYFAILQAAHEKNIDIIAITDHNTLAGFEKLFELKMKYENKVVLLQEFKDDSVRIKELIDDINCKLELYKNIVILPGVEITLNPGVHMLVISDLSNIDDLRVLLREIGYTDDENISSEGSIKTDIKMFLENPLLENMLVIAPHIDSKNGIYNDIKRGNYRADIFKSSVIDAMTCNSISQLNNIKNLLNTDINYKRDKPIAFINASDAHQTEDIGSKISYVKLENKNVEDLKKAFINPDDKVSDTSNQNLSKTINKILEGKDAFVIQDIEQDDAEFLSKRICACLNNGYNNILLGISTKKFELYGINMAEEDLSLYIRKSLDDIKSRFGRLRYNITIESMGNGRQIAILKLKPEVFNLWYLGKNKDIYLVDNDKIKVASIEEIERLVVENTLLEIQGIEDKKDESVNTLILRMKTLKYTTIKFEIIQNIDQYSYPIIYCMNTVQSDEYEKASILLNDNVGNGECDGNLFFVEKTDFRLDNAILRYSCPVIQIDDDLCKDIPTSAGDKIIICENGGTYLITKDIYRLMGVSCNYIVLDLKEEFKDKFSLYSIIGWLKSSVQLWYILTKSQSANLYQIDVLRNISIPELECLKPAAQVEENVKKILDLEYLFLKEYRMHDICGECKNVHDDCYDMCLMDTYINKHNKQITDIATEIDKLILNEIGIDNDKEIELIKNEIEASQYFNIL